MMDYNLEEDDINTPENYGYVSIDEIPDINYLKDSIKQIVRAVYKTGDIYMLESYLDEICGELDIEIGKDEPVIQGKSGSFYLQHHQEQRTFLDKIGRKTI